MYSHDNITNGFTIRLGYSRGCLRRRQLTVCFSEILSRSSPTPVFFSWSVGRERKIWSEKLAITMTIRYNKTHRCDGYISEIPSRFFDAGVFFYLLKFSWLIVTWTKLQGHFFVFFYYINQTGTLCVTVEIFIICIVYDWNAFRV